MFPLALLLAASGPAQQPATMPVPGGSTELRMPAQIGPTPAHGPTPFTLPQFIYPSGQPHSTAPVPLMSIEDCLRACPPANDPAPFLRLPKVSVVEECRTTDGDGKCESAPAWKHTWHTAAKFTVPRFDLTGEPMDGDSLVIYEGMTLTVNQTTGVYDLSFTATHPPTPVLLWLQLEFILPPERKDSPVRLTLPPIRFEVEDLGRAGDAGGRTVRVQHRGRSDLFMKSSAVPNPTRTTDLVPGFVIDETARVIRLGTARFGSGRVSSGELDR